MRFIINLFFLQEIWGINIRPFSNGPYWSLGYEYWYYVLFGILYFFKDKKKYLLICAIIIFVGPYIVQYGLIWGVGAGTYFLQKYCLQNKKVKNGGYIITVILLFCSIVYSNSIDDFYYKIIHNKYYIKDLPSSLITAILLSLNIFLFEFINRKIWVCNFVAYFKIDQIIKKLAQFSFSVYLLHFPLLLFFLSLMKLDARNNINIIILFCCTLAACYCLSLFTEKKKNVIKNLIYLQHAYWTGFLRRKDENG